MRRHMRAFAACGVAVAALGGRAAAADLTDHQRAIVAAIEACEADKTLKWCEPFRALIDHLNETPPPPVAAPVSTAETIKSVGRLGDDFEQALKTGLTYPKGADVSPTVTPVDTATYASGHGAGPGGESVAAAGAASVTLQATTDTKTASVALNVDLSKRFGGLPYNLTLTGQTPLGQDAKFQNLATQDGLTKATSIDFKVTRLFQDVTYDDNRINSDQYQQTCVGVLKAIKAAHPQVEIRKSLLAPYGCHAGRVLDLVGKLVLEDDEKAALTKVLQELDSAVAPVINSMFLLSGHATVGYESHAFYDPAKLDPAVFDPTKTGPDHVIRTPFAIGVAGTYVFHGGDMSVGGAFDFQRSYEDGGDDGQTSTLCPAQAVKLLTCVAGYVGHPLRKDQYLLTGQYRYIAPSALGLPLGVNPTFTYDFKSDEYGFQLPIYLVADGNKALTGGIRYDWTSKDHHSVVGIFVTSAFCLLPGYAACTTVGSGS